MQILREAITYAKNLGKSEKYCQKSQLIQYITWEFVVVGFIFSGLYAFSKLPLLVFLICFAVGLALVNLLIFHQTKNVIVCGHILMMLIFITVTSGNYMIWGLGPAHSQWFYVMPLVAAAVTGIKGLFFYSFASFSILLGTGKLIIPPYYEIPEAQFAIIKLINLIFAYLIIVTTLASLIYENKKYADELSNKNYLLQEEKDRYHYLARFDPLTELPNRRYFIQYLQELIDSIAPGNAATVFFIDLDNFKRVNDNYGHNAGDQLLLETSRRLQCCFREKDFISRLGGDEFTAVILHAANKNIPEIIAQRIIYEFEHSFIFNNQIEYHYSISIGFATYPHEAQSAADLVIKADEAMYEAKKILGNSYSSAKNLTN